MPRVANRTAPPLAMPLKSWPARRSRYVDDASSAFVRCHADENWSVPACR